MSFYVRGKESDAAGKREGFEEKMNGGSHSFLFHSRVKLICLTLAIGTKRQSETKAENSSGGICRKDHILTVHSLRSGWEGRGTTGKEHSGESGNKVKTLGGGGELSSEIKYHRVPKKEIQDKWKRLYPGGRSAGR